MLQKQYLYMSVEIIHFCKFTEIYSKYGRNNEKNQPKTCIFSIIFDFRQIIRNFVVQKTNTEKTLELMKQFLYFTLSLFFILASFSSCHNSKKADCDDYDTEAMRLFEGVWYDVDESQVSFRVSGDSIFYPYDKYEPVSFYIKENMLCLVGSRVQKLEIVKQSEHIFQFKNSNGDLVKLRKMQGEMEEDVFDSAQDFDTEINQELIKKDTIVSVGDKKWHCYVQVNPTTYKVLRMVYKDNGVGGEQAYYDNIIHLAVYEGNNKLFSKDLFKKDFSAFVPEGVLEQSVLNDLVYVGSDSEGVKFQADIRRPEASDAYLLIVYVTRTDMKIIQQ